MIERIRPLVARALIVVVGLSVLIVASPGVSAGAAEDRSAPQRLDSSADPSVVDVTEGSAAVTISVHVTDDTAVSTPVVILGSDLTDQTLGFGQMSLRSGTLRDGVWARTVLLPQTATSGSWHATLYPLVDSLGNSSSAFVDIAPFEVLGGVPLDDDAPVRGEASIEPAAVDVSTAPVTVTARVRVQDATGVAAPTMIFGSDVSDQTLGFGSMTLESGSVTDGVWKREVSIPTTATNGSWHATLYPLRDSLGNSGSGLVDVASFSVAGGIPVDTTGPVRVGASVTPTSFDFVDGPAVVVVRVHLSDPSGVQAPSMLIASEETTQTQGFGEMALVEGTVQDGWWERRVTIPVSAASGAWRVTLYPLWDTLGNQSDSFVTLGTITIARSSVPSPTPTPTPTPTATPTPTPTPTATPSPTPTPTPTPTATPSPTPTPTPTPTPSGPPAVTRISGADRYEVAVRVAQASYPTGASTVYVVTGENYPDALGAGPAAIKQNAPLLLTTSSALPPSVSAAIKELDPDTIVIVGGPNSVSASVESELNTIAHVVRISGSDRFEASRNLAEYAWGETGAAVAYLATGTNFPDALSAGAASGSFDAPVILVNGSQTALDDATRALLQHLGVSSIKIAGGPNSVSAGIQNSAERLADTTRLAGNDRFAASLAINEDAFASAQQVFLATGLKFPDALAGSAYAGSKSSPLLVVPPDCVPQGVKAYLADLGVTKVTLLGGPASLSAAVGELRPCAF